MKCILCIPYTSACITCISCTFELLRAILSMYQKSVRTLSNFMKISRNSSAATFQTGHDDSAPVRGRCLSRDVNTPSAPSKDLIHQFFWSKTSQLWANFTSFHISSFYVGFCFGFQPWKAWHWKVKEVKMAAMNSKTACAPSPKSWPCYNLILSKSLQWHYMVNCSTFSHAKFGSQRRKLDLETANVRSKNAEKMRSVGKQSCKPLTLKTPLLFARDQIGCRAAFLLQSANPTCWASWPMSTKACMRAKGKEHAKIRISKSHKEHQGSQVLKAYFDIISAWPQVGGWAFAENSWPLGA